MYRYCIGEPCTHFLYGIVYQQKHKSRDSNRCLSCASLEIYWLLSTK